MSIDIRDALFQKVYDLAEKDKDIVLISADADAFILRKFAKDMPDQFILTGVAEQNVIAVAAGLALSGKKVFVYAILPFITYRVFEQIKVNICSMNLPVTIIGIGVGFSFSYDGPTHHGVSDIGVMRTLPELSIYNPNEAKSASYCVETAYHSATPAFIRLDKGQFVDTNFSNTELENGFRYIEGKNLLVISTGTLAHNVKKVVEKINEIDNFDIGFVDIFRLKPVAVDHIIKIIKSYRKLISFEENTLTGNLSSIMAEILIDNGITIPYKRIAILDEQTMIYGTREWLLKQYGLDESSIYKTIKGFLV